MSRLLANHLYVKAEKCEFHVSSTTFLGYRISPKGMEMDTGKNRCMVLPQLRNCKGSWDLHIFTGGLSVITAPLQPL